MTVTDHSPDRWTRRTALKTFAAGSTLALAGCSGIGGDADDTTDDTDDTDDIDTTDDTDDTPTDESNDEEATTPEEEEEDEDEEEADEDEEEPDDVQQLVDIFDDQPFNDAQFEIEGENREYTPRHVWKFVSEEAFIGLHFDEPNPEEANELDYITVGWKGVFSEESQPDEEFTHFHKVEADSWEAGHGGSDTDDEGYWLTHIAVREIQYPFHSEPITPRVDYEFMPTPPEEGSTGHHTDFTSPGGDEGSLSAADRDALLEVFDDQLHNDDQHEVSGSDRDYTPRHIWWQANEDVSLFLHFDEPNPEEASELDYFGIGVDAQFTADDIPAGQVDDFTHFHLYEADSWEAGHGGDDTNDGGMWLVHHSVREVQYPFHGEPIGVGVDREFMPTPAPDQ